MGSVRRQPIAAWGADSFQLPPRWLPGRSRSSSDEGLPVALPLRDDEVAREYRVRNSMQASYLYRRRVSAWAYGKLARGALQEALESVKASETPLESVAASVRGLEGEDPETRAAAEAALAKAADTIERKDPDTYRTARGPRSPLGYTGWPSSMGRTWIACLPRVACQPPVLAALLRLLRVPLVPAALGDRLDDGLRTGARARGTHRNYIYWPPPRTARSLRRRNAAALRPACRARYEPNPIKQ